MASAAIRKRRMLTVLGYVTTVIRRLGWWFSHEVSDCPENDLDSLLWPIFLSHVKLIEFHAHLTKGWFAQWSIRATRLVDLWYYYWGFQTHEYRQKSRNEILRVTRLYKEKK